MKKIGTLPYILLLSAWILSACSGTPGPQPNLDGTAWVLTTIHGSSVIPASSPSLRFDDGQVSGNGSCNSFGGEYSQSGGKISIGPLMSTLMACEPAELMNQEQTYLTALQSADRFVVEEGMLHLYHAGGELLLTFTAVDNSLEGRTWQMTSLNYGMGDLVSAVPGSIVTGEFARGTLSGSAGCNQYGASYQQVEDRLEIEPTSVTEMYCEEPAGVMEQEFLYLQALSQTASFRVEGDRLTLIGADGITLVEFTAAP